MIPQSRLSVPDATNYQYDAVGNRLSENGVNMAGAPVNRSYSYDSANRLQQVSGDVQGALTFQYDNNGNLSSQTQGTQTTRYEYDTRDQMRRVLSGATGNSEVASFDYDYGRRRLSKTTGSTTLSFVYAGDNVINEYEANNTLVNRYDYGTDLIRGELNTEGEKFYFSDALGSVTALAQVSGGAPSRYEYDGWGIHI